MNLRVLGLLSAFSLVCVAGAAPCALPEAPARVPADETANFQQLVETRAPAIVTIKYILKSPEGEQEEEVTGVLISGDGLALASNFAFGGGPSGGGAQPTDIKVLVGEDTQGVDATFVAKDTELGLAWIRVDKAPDKAYTFVDFKDGASATLGDHIYCVRKMGKFFGLANSVAEARVGCTVTKPRSLIIPSIGLASRSADLAMPVYNSAGKPVGVTTFIIPEEDEMTGSSAALRGMDFGMVLPAKDVMEATQKALENAKKPAEAKPADAPETKPAEAPKDGAAAPK